MKLLMSLAACFLAAIGLLGAQDGAKASPQGPAVPELTLDRVLAAAAAAGDDFVINAGALDVAKKQRALDLAKQGLSIGASGGYALADGIGDDSTSGNQALVGKAVSVASGNSVSSSVNGLANAPQGTLSLSGPWTKASLSVAHSLPMPLPPSTQTSAAASIQSSVLGLTINQTIYDGYPGGQYRGALAQSLLSYRISELSSLQGNSAAITKVKNAYIVMLAAERDLDIKRQVRGKQQSLLAQIQAIFDLKQATSIDLLTAQVNARSAQIDVATSEKGLRLARERLAVIMGSADPTHASFIVAELQDPALPAASIEEAIAIGLKKRTDLAQLDLRSQSSQIGADLARAQAKPTVALTGGLGTAVGWTATPVAAGAFSLGAKVALPVYDAGAADFQARTSEGQSLLYGYQAAQLRKTLASDIRDFYESASLSSDRVALARDSMDLADRQFDLVQAQNQYGTATLQDLLTASVNRSSAEVGYQTARSAYLSAVLQLSTAMGL